MKERRAFVQVELVTIVVLAGMLIAFLSITAQHARHRARLAGSISNLQRFAGGITTFGADHADRLVSFSWRAGPARTGRDGYAYPAQTWDVGAAGDEAVDIMRSLSGRRDIAPMSSWIPLGHHYLPMLEHMGLPLPADFVVSPFDANRLAWQRAARIASTPEDAHAAFLQLPNRPMSGDDNRMKRWVYSSSYEFAPASFSPDAYQVTPDGVTNVLSQDLSPTPHNQYSAGPSSGQHIVRLGRRQASEIDYPDKKAIVYETHPAASSGTRSFFAHDHAKVPILFGDGSASVRLMADANRGFRPTAPSMRYATTQLSYGPELSWEPHALSPSGADIVYGRVRWTRSGLRGRDFNGPEVHWKD